MTLDRAPDFGKEFSVAFLEALDLIGILEPDIAFAITDTVTIEDLWELWGKARKEESRALRAEAAAIREGE